MASNSIPDVSPDLQQYLHGINPPVPSISVDPKAKPQDRLMQGLNQGGIPVLAPDGKPGFVHQSGIDAFLQANPDYKLGVVMTAPDGHPGVVARDQAGEFLKANPTYTVGQPTTRVESNPLAQYNEVGGFRFPKFEEPTTAEKFIPPLYIPKVLRTIRQSAGLIGENLRQEGKAPTAPPFVKNISSPVGEAATSFVGSQYEPSNLAALGALRYLPTSSAALRTLHRGAGAYFTGQMAKGAAQGAVGAYRAAEQGNIPEAVRQGTEAGLYGAMAGATGYQTGKAMRGAVQDLRATPGELAATRPAQAIIQSRPVQAIAERASDLGAVLNPTKAGAVASATMAFRPRNSKYQWKEQVRSALPDMRRAADELNMDPEHMTLEDAHRAATQAKRDVWREYSEQYADPNAGDAVDTTPVANVIRSTITPRMAEQNPGLVNRIGQVADTYEGRTLSLQDIEERMHELNNETAAIEARYPQQKMAAQSDPQNAYVFAERQALRNLADSKMNELSGPGANQLRARYGALKSVEDVIQRRIPVAERQAPESLPSMLTKMWAGAKLATGVATLNPAMAMEGATSLYLRNRLARLNDPNYLTSRAFQQTTPSGPIPPPPERLSGEYVGPDYVAPNRRGILGLLGPMRLPAENAPPTNAVEAVGMPPTAEAQAIQSAFERNSQAFQTIPAQPPTQGLPRLWSDLLRPRGELPAGVYEQPGGFEPTQLALPENVGGRPTPPVTPEPPISLNVTEPTAELRNGKVADSDVHAETPKLPPVPETATAPVETKPAEPTPEEIAALKAKIAALEQKVGQGVPGILKGKKAKPTEEVSRGQEVQKPEEGQISKAVPTAGGKKPWEMTYREFADFYEDGRPWTGNGFSFAEEVGKPLGIRSQGGGPISPEGFGYRGSLPRERWRRAIVESAVHKGEKVPAEVLADYPELTTEAAKPATPKVPDLAKSAAAGETKAERREVISTAKKEYASGQRMAGQEGADTKLLTSEGEHPAKYRVVEAADLTPSHNPLTFAKNPAYPADIQERAYDTSKEAQSRVIEQTQRYDPNYTINTNPDAVNGPPIITPDGVVLGGNSRTMSTQRLYKAGEGNRYKNALLAQAQTFGLDKEAIRGMKEPILVREVEAPKTIEETRALASQLNKSMIGALGVSERAVSAGKAISRSSLNAVAGMIDSLGDNASLRDAMRERGKEIVDLMVKDGAITDRERPQFVDTATGGLSEEGKTFVERALLGSVVDDPRLMDAVPKGVLNKLDSSLAALASLAPRTDAYNIMPLIREALREHAEIAQRGIPLEDYLSQSSLFGGERDPAVDAIVRTLAERPTLVKAKLRQFAQDANFDMPGQTTLALGTQPSPSEAFKAAFGLDISEEQLENSIIRSAQSDVGAVHDRTVEGEAKASAGNLQQSATREASASRKATPPAVEPTAKAEVKQLPHFLTKLTRERK